MYLVTLLSHMIMVEKIEKSLFVQKSYLKVSYTESDFDEDKEKNNEELKI